MQQKAEKKFFDFEIIAFELVALDTRFYWENTCDRVSVCQQIVLRFQILLKESLWSWFPFRAIKKCDKNSANRFKSSFGHFKMLTVHKCSDTGLFRHLSNRAFCTL